MSTDHASRTALNGTTMGTRWSAVLYVHGAVPSGLQAELQAVVDEVDATMSSWKVDSDLMRLNRTPPGVWQAVAPSLCAVVDLGLQIGQASHGAFDIGVGAAVNAWGFGAIRSQPDATAIAAVASASRGEPAAEVDLSRSRLRRNGPAQIDLAGIAKGYGVDCLADVLITNGITDFIVSIDGEIRTHGNRHDGSGWMVGLERPDRVHRGLARTIEVGDLAIATSGDYRRWHQYGDTTVSHTIDPHKGTPLQNRVYAVTVTAEHCAVADAWATALMVLGETDGPAMARQHGLDAVFTLRTGKTLQEICVGAFAPA